MEEVQAQVTEEAVERLGDAFLFQVGLTGQALDRTLPGGIGPEQGVPGEQEQELAEPLRVGQLGQQETLAIALAPVGAVETQLDEVADQHPAAAIHLGGIAEGLFDRGEPAVARALPGVQVGARPLEFQYRPGQVDGRPIPAQAGVRRPVALHRLGAGLGL